MTSCAWLWVYAGIAVMLLELVTPGFILVFFGLSAVTVGALRGLIGPAFGDAWQVAAFSLFAVLYLVFLRRYLKNTLVGTRDTSKADFDHESVGRMGTVTVRIDPPKTGRVLIGDAEWTATSDAPIAEGSSVKVVGQENLTMRVVLS